MVVEEEFRSRRSFGFDSYNFQFLSNSACRQNNGKMKDDSSRFRELEKDVIRQLTTKSGGGNRRDITLFLLPYVHKGYSISISFLLAFIIESPAGTSLTSPTT